MNRAKGSRHLSELEISQIANWIVGSESVPSWAEVADYAYANFGVGRKVEAIRRRKELKVARDARRSVPALRPRMSKLTKRKVNSLEAENRRLESEVARLEMEVSAVLERNFRLVNAMALRQIPESLMERPLPPINRDPTYPKK